MDYTVTLTIPEEIYRTAEATAHNSNQSVDQVLSHKLSEAFQPLPTLYVSPNRMAMLREVEAYEAMHSQLLANHLGDFVAIHGGQLVDFDRNEDALLERRRDNYPNQVVLIRRVETVPQADLIYRSPRFA